MTRAGGRGVVFIHVQVIRILVAATSMAIERRALKNDKNIFIVRNILDLYPYSSIGGT
jgi:hypothetical protein